MRIAGFLTMLNKTIGSIKERIRKTEKTHVISLKLDSINEVFDDFDNDTTLFAARTISEDFIDALKLRYREYNRAIKLVLYVPVQEKEIIEANNPIIIEQLQDELSYRLKAISKQNTRQAITPALTFTIGASALIFFKEYETFFTAFYKGLSSVLPSMDFSYLAHETALIVAWGGILETITLLIQSAKDKQHFKDSSFLKKIGAAEIRFNYY